MRTMANPHNHLVTLIGSEHRWLVDPTVIHNLAALWVSLRVRNWERIIATHGDEVAPAARSVPPKARWRGRATYPRKFD